MANDLFAQNADQPSGRNCPQEKMEVHISHGSAFPGELVWFKIYCTSPLLPADNLSSLAFIELVSSENSSILRKKILLNRGEGMGEFQIPDNLPTGLYYFMAYTNWMKNFGEASFFKKEMIIINPNLPLNNVQKKADSLKSLEGSTAIVAAANKLKISPDKNKYATREQVTIKIEPNSTSGKQISGDFSVSVYRKEPQMIYNTKKSNEGIVYKNPEKITYLPDYKGVRLSGKLLDASDNGISGVIVTESTPGPGIDIKCSLTDSKGDFNFLLRPREGEQQIIFTQHLMDTKISLEESYWNGFRDAPDNMAVGLSNEAVDYLKGKFIHLQFQNSFRKQNHIQNTPDKMAEDSSVFYLKPYKLFTLKDYVKLDSLREYFYELVPSVRFSQRKGEIDIAFRDLQNQTILEDKPGVFLDGIFYNNYSEIANIPVKDIDRFAILPSTYYYKDFTFGGIIDIHTKKSDFNSVKILPNMTRIIYPMANASEWKFKSPDYSASMTKDRTPDFRYLLYWEPNVKVENSSGAKVQFYTGDVKGKFIVKVTGMTKDDEILQSENEILVGD